MSNPDKIPGQSYRVRPEASAELDLLSALLRCGTGVECGRAVAAGLLREFGGLAGVSAADSSALTRAGLTGRAAAAIGRARSLAVAMARVEACRRPVLALEGDHGPDRFRNVQEVSGSFTALNPFTWSLANVNDGAI